MSGNMEAMWKQQAFICYLADKLGETEKLGKKAMQKYAYLIQELARVPLDYSFRFYTYGPFSSELAGDLDIADSFGGLSIRYREEDNAFIIRRGEKADHFIDKGRDFISRHRNDIDHIISAFGNRYAKDLELTATILYLLRNSYGRVKLGDDDLIKMVKKVKPKYDSAGINTALRELKEIGGKYKFELTSL